jgi:hypothetical protein
MYEEKPVDGLQAWQHEENGKALILNDEMEME